MANKLERAIALGAVSIAQGQSEGKIPRDVVTEHDYVQEAIAKARETGATKEQIRRAVRIGRTGRPNPSLN